MLNLDTHILLHALAGDLSKKEKSLLSNHSWSISAVVLWEVAKLSQLGRIEMDLKDSEVSQTLNRIHTWPITWEIARTSTKMDFKSDPADEIIAATSIIHRIPLLTRDKKILRSKLIPFA